MTKLKYSTANTKLRKLYENPLTAAFLDIVLATGQTIEQALKVYALDLPAGWSCPFADACLAKVTETPEGKRKIKDGPNQVFRCYAASQAVRFPAVHNKQMHNFNLLRSLGNDSRKIADLINSSLPSDAGIVRIHSSGGFYSQAYFDAWLMVARHNPHRRFYAYLKALQYWLNRFDDIPDNLKLTASRGGTQDHLIDAHNLPEARVVYSYDEADQLGLEIDDDDSHACLGTGSFALLIHGSQKAGSEAGKALQLLKAAK